MIAVVVSCGDAEMFVEPEGSDFEVKGVIAEEPSSDKIFLVVEKDPTFPGGREAYKKFLDENLVYPEEAKLNGIEGNVYLTFVVDTDGSLYDFKVIKGPDSGLREEALRVFMAGPNWIPGMQREQAVKTKITVRVAFRLDEHTGSSLN